MKMTTSKLLKPAETMQPFTHLQNHFPDICCGALLDSKVTYHLCEHNQWLGEHVDVHCDRKL